MRVVIAGGSGFLGSMLQAQLRGGGHDVRLLTRQAAAGARDQIEWLPNGSVGAWAGSLEGADAVVNLSGAGIADARWTTARKALLRDSRILSTRSLVLAMQQRKQPPAVFVSASGIGYYGDRGAAVVTEDTPPGSDFLATLCTEWEHEAEYAAAFTRVVVLRNGVVLDPAGGALAKMLLPFRLGLGGPLGSGAQYFPWIHRDDWVRFVLHMMTEPAAHGPFNVTAPNPATNAEFTRALGRALGRPTFIPVPSFGLRTALGELAETLLTGQRAVPQRAETLGFTFRFREIQPALEDLLR